MFSVIVMMTHAQMITDGEGDIVVVCHFLIVQYTNEPISVKCLVSFFIVDKANTSLYIFMRKAGSCDESYQG